MSCKEGLAINRAVLAWKAATCKCSPMRGPGIAEAAANAMRLRREINERTVGRMNEQWEEIRIEDVQPGDVARCNGREFRVQGVHVGPSLTIHGDSIPPSAGYIAPQCWGWSYMEAVGFTFHRKVKREPRTCVSTVQNGVLFSIAYLPGSWDNGTRVRVTELLDSEDGA